MAVNSVCILNDDIRSFEDITLQKCHLVGIVIEHRFSIFVVLALKTSLVIFCSSGSCSTPKLL